MSSSRRAWIGAGVVVWTALWVQSARMQAHATSYTVPADHHVVCLDLKTGKRLWQSAPGPLLPPVLQVADDVLVVEDGQSLSGEPAPVRTPRPRGAHRYLLDPGTGRLVRTRPGTRSAAPTAAALKPLGALTDSRGRTFVFDAGNTHALIARSPDGETETILQLEGYLTELSLVGHLAIFSFGVGDVYAYDLQERRLAWEFDASRALPNLSDRVYTGAAADAQGVYVSVDQTLFALAPDSGRLLWTTALPRQALRRFDSAFTKMARVGDRLMVLVYETLFQIDPASGRIVWSFSAGEFAEPWPILYRDRLYVASREEPPEPTPPAQEAPIPANKEREDRRNENPELAQLRQQYRASFDVSHGARKRSALRIKHGGAALTLELLSRREIPPDEPVFWSLRPPPPPASQPAHRTLLKLWDGRAPSPDGLPPVTLDLTGPLAQRPAAYVKFIGSYDSAELSVDGKTVATQRW